MKLKMIFPALLLIFATVSGLVSAADDELPAQVLIKDVHVWDGLSDGVTKKINVLIEGNKVKKLRATDANQ